MSFQTLLYLEASFLLAMVGKKVKASNTICKRLQTREEVISVVDETRQLGALREDALTLQAYIALYRCTQDAAHKDRAMKMLCRSVPAAEMCPAWACGMFFALEETGEECWRGTIEQVMQKTLPEPMNLAEAYDVLPLRMAYEMKLNHMAWVSRVADSFKRLHKALFDAQAGLHRAAEGAAYSPDTTGWFMLALVDAIEICDQQLYEHWRALVDIFRETLRGLVKHGNVDGAEAKIAAAVLKAVRLGIIDPERYLPLARKLAPEHSGLYVGDAFLAHAEHLLAGGEHREN